MNKPLTLILGLVLFAGLVIGYFYWSSHRSSPLGEVGILSGTVTYRERMALPPGSVVHVEINDVSLADAPARNIGRTEFVTSGENVPIPFTVEYDPRAIDPRMTYSVSARIIMGGQLRFITDTHTPLLDQNNRPIQSVDLMLVGVSSDAPGVVQRSPDAGVAAQVETADLNRRSFRLVAYNGRTLPIDTNYVLNFVDGRLSSKFCNNMNGSYLLDEGVLKATLASTLMFCSLPDDIMDLEYSFGVLVGNGAKLTLNQGTLTLTGEDAMVFTEILVP